MSATLDHHSTSIRQWISLKEAANLIPVPVSTDSIRRWAQAGQVESLKIGSRLFVSRVSIEQIARNGM